MRIGIEMAIQFTRIEFLLEVKEVIVVVRQRIMQELLLKTRRQV
ncbi:putative conjugative transfer protein TraA [Orientia tsutsugamushi str. Gilliam]|uniref:Putative conjugative transfer protein TraA n=1 Tax=Orientia tsutsugamushi str. Gilliam TaxID=1359184 RepID=A0A0F3M4H0_ORITS|nr:hypothetical protein [Orientia tsutsugamushi]KJV50593.1 putative conjugative transfer protein TraA [Orientia tsutsugamushi str. Gilliam]